MEALTGPWTFCSISQEEDPNVKISVFPGILDKPQPSALESISKGDIIIPMDGDLQNDPEDILPLLQKIEEGYDVVSGWRKNRKDPFLDPSVTIDHRQQNHLLDWGCSSS